MGAGWRYCGELEGKRERGQEKRGNGKEVKREEEEEISSGDIRKG